MKASVLPLLRPIRRRLGLGEGPPLAQLATRRIEVAPPERHTRPKAIYLEGQLERIEDWVFIDHHPAPDLVGGDPVLHGATTAMLLHDVLLLDGLLVAGKASVHLSNRRHRLPSVRAEESRVEGALYASTVGNKYFGNWILDDLPRYTLAQAYAPPVTTQPSRGGHYGAYETALGHAPIRAERTHFERLWIFDDVGQNRHKRTRFEALAVRLAGEPYAPPHPGVFITRGKEGERRVLANEDALAERLARARGFRVLDPLRASLVDIVQACRGAQVVIGVEGSALAHGALFLGPGTTIFTLQPPRRFCTVFKDVADRQELRFAFVVGQDRGGDFYVDEDEVERTLDLCLPRPSA